MVPSTGRAGMHSSVPPSPQKTLFCCRLLSQPPPGSLIYPCLPLTLSLPNTAIILLIWVSLWTEIRISLGYIPKVGMSGGHAYICAYSVSKGLTECFPKCPPRFVLSLSHSVADSCLNTPCQTLLLPNGPKNYFILRFSDCYRI